MRRLLLAAAALAPCASAWAEPGDLARPFEVASLSLTGFGSANDAAAFPYPALNSAAFIGDSRIQNSISYSTSALTTFYGSLNLVLGYGEWAILASGNNLLPAVTGPYGVGSTTSLSMLDRATGASNYLGSTIGSTVTHSAGASTATIAAALAANGYFPGYLTPGSMATSGAVTLTFGTAGSVSSSCGAGSGYTPFTLTDSNGDTIPGGCVSNAYSGSVTYGGASTAHNPYANFTVTQPASGGTLLAAGDTYVFTTFGPQARAYSVSGDFAGNPVDNEWNIQGSGAYSPVGDPANVTVMIDSINDSSYLGAVAGSAYGDCPGPNYAATYPSMTAATPCLSMVNIAAALDLYKAAGKLVFLGDESPQGVSTIELEAHTLAAAATTVTATQGATFQADGGDWGLSTTGLGQPLTAVPGLIGVVASTTTPIAYTKVSTLTGANYQYTVSAAGLYTLNATDPLSVSGGTAYLTYAYGTGGTGAYQKTMHAWLHSSLADFTYNGTDYHFPGALYGRPNVVSVPHFEALVDQKSGNWSASDPDCLTHACLAVPGAIDSLQKHPTVYGGALFAQAFKQAWSGIPAYASLADNSKLPTYNNLRCAKETPAGTLTLSCTMPPTMYSTGHPAVKLCYQPTSTTFQCDTESGGTFSDANIASSSVNYTTGAVSVTFASGKYPYVNTYLYLIEDPTNGMSNPMLDATSGIGYSGDNATAPCVGSGITYMPTGWACTPAGTTGLTFTWSTGTNAAGAPTLTVTITGVAAAAGTLNVTNGSWGDPYPLSILNGNKVRAGIVETFSAYNGHLYGIYGAPLTMTANAASFTYPGFYTISGNTSAPTAFTSLKLVSGANPTSGLFPLTDLMIGGLVGNTSGLSLNLLSQTLDLTAATVTGGATFYPQIIWAAGPVNGSATFAQASMRARN